MTSARRILTILGTLFCALATGFFMQHFMQGQPGGDGAEEVRVASRSTVQDVAPIASDVLAEPQSSVETVSDVAEQETDTKAASVDEPEPTEAERANEETGLETKTITIAAVTSAIPVPPTAAPHPESLPSEPVVLAALDDLPVSELPAEVPAPAFGCEIKLSTAPAPAAMVELSIAAPCLPNERFTIHHNGMVFSDVTGPEGDRTILVPVLSENAIFIATFSSGDSSTAKAEVDSLEYYDRAVVQGSYPDGVQIHALEYGADYGDEDGHVWYGAAQDMAEAAKGEGGFLVRLGDPQLENPMTAEVYTFPSGTALREGEVRMSLEAEVTVANCDRNIEAQTLQKTGKGRLRVRELELAMPACDAIGDFLVLSDMLDDLRIARK